MQDDRFLPPEQPPGVKPVRHVSVWRYIVAGVLVVGFVAAAIFVPIPMFFLYQPGPVTDLEDLVRASDAKTYSSEGSLFMTTVGVDDSVTLVNLIVAWVDPEQDVVLRDEVTGGQPLQEFKAQQRAQMQESQDSAKQVALSELGFDRPMGDGAEVVRTIEDAPADGVLLPNDVIVEIDGVAVQTTCDIGAVIGEREIDDRISITYERDSRIRTSSVRLADNPYGEGAFLGIEMRTLAFSFEPGVDVDFETGRIAGPSAGLMLALALYDQLTPEDLTTGLEIAGTGTLDCDGEVGPIGGIRQKVAGARAKGAEIFLAPLGNFDEARAVADGIEVVPVGTFAQALEYLTGRG